MEQHVTTAREICIPPARWDANTTETHHLGRSLRVSSAAVPHLRDLAPHDDVEGVDLFPATAHANEVWE